MYFLLSIKEMSRHTGDLGEYYGGIFSGSLGITVELAEKPVSCSANLLKTLSRVLSYISICTATPKDPIFLEAYSVDHRIASIVARLTFSIFSTRY